MTSIFHCVFAMLLGIALSFFGVSYSISKCPGTLAFFQLRMALPALGAVLLFFLCIGAAIAGVYVLVTSFKRLRHNWRFLRQLTTYHRSQPRYHGNGQMMHEEQEEEERQWSGSYR